MHQQSVSRVITIAALAKSRRVLFAALAAIMGFSVLCIGMMATGLSSESEVADAKGEFAASVGTDDSLPQPKVDMAIVRTSQDEGKTVNLTLDDGPDPRWTPKFLDLLKQHGAKAVFCVTGPNAAARPDLVKRIVAEGHRLCDHSVSHDTAMDGKPVAYQEKEILDAKRMIDEASGGKRIWYYRAPGGAFTPESRQIAAAHSMVNLGWNVDPRDFERPGTERIVAAVKAQITKGPTVLMHDGGSNRTQSLAALKELLPWFKEQGYAFSFPKAD
ncbi:polysaccharide deacetylase family protein [Streptomyces sp. NPDC004111]|uniref:polysaccharide deacetylase family protein n=1 Tax=Streptomyces sp. NPDC004111 TaxID=3364690 RepID=UPI00368718C8